MRISSGEFYQHFYKDKHLKRYFFIPNDLSSVVRELKIDCQLTSMLMLAHRELGILEGMTKYITQISPFEDMILCTEACNSCAIDKILATCIGVLVNKKSDVGNTAAHNCYQAMKALDREPLTTEIVCHLHRAVMQGMTEGTTGKLRKTPFFMHPNYTTNSVEYNPPLPELINDLLEEFMEFVRSNDRVDVLVKASLAYYQFETIHPFESGNGRLGRLFPAKILLESGVLSRPLLTISNYLFENNDECLRMFMGVQHFGAYLDWIKFFVQGIIESTRKVIRQLDLASGLRKESIHKIKSLQKFDKTLLPIYEYAEQKPIICIKEISQYFHVSYNTAAKAISVLEDLKILSLKHEQIRYKEFTYDMYINIFGCTS